MARVVQSEDVRSRVLDAARLLFIEKGYEAATIRQISVMSGVSSGSIYHFFADKEGVFLHLTLHFFEDAMRAAEERTARQKDPYLSLALKWAYLMRLISSDKRVAELFSVAYRSWKISKELMRAATLRHQLVLSATLTDWDDERFFVATLLLGGVLSALVDERVNLDSLTEEKRIRALLSTALPAFGAEADQVQRLTMRALKLLPAIATHASDFGAA